MQVSTRGRGGCVVHRCQNKNPRERLTSGCEWRHALEVRGRRILGILKKSGEDGWLSLVPLSQAMGLWRVWHMLGGRWKSQNWKNVYLSPYVEELLNLKVIKSFVPELRSRKCFSCFEIPMFYVYILWTLYVHFIHIRIMGMVHTYLAHYNFTREITIKC